ncbi:hypothetical protein AX16_005869 [Volvariella volvacea WC 439]|nr:hypothetical protein AX16_005869 [Volvariella volvacea WC 439]
MTSSTATPANSIHQNVVPSEVGWQFVPQYYTFVNKEPDRLHCFYTKQSTFTHGTEGEEGKPCFGQQEIHSKIQSIGFKDCKVFIHSVDAQSSSNGGIIIQVIGEMSNQNEPWRKFVQTFFLAEQPNGYFVLNDIFRFLKEDAVDEEEEAAEGEPAPAPAPEPAPTTNAAQTTPPIFDSPRQPTPPPPAPEAPTPTVSIPTSAPVEEAPTNDVPETPTSQPPAPVPEPEPVVTSAPTPPPAQPNGIHAPEPEKAASAATPVEKSAAPSPAPPQPPAAPSPAPSATPSSTAAAPAAPPAAQSQPPQQPQEAQTQPPVQAPTPAPAPSAPRSWASLAASNSKKWGSNVAQEGRGISETPVSSAPVPAPRPPHHGGHGGAPGGPRPDHPNLIAAQSITHAQCFIKGVTEAISHTMLREALSRFGTTKDIDVVRGRQVAYVEFETVDSAKRAIIASLPQNQGGGGGVWIDVNGAENGQVRISVEVKKEKGERGGPGGPGGIGRGGRDGGARGGHVNGERQDGGRGGYRGRGGPRGGRGGGGAGPK